MLIPLVFIRHGSRNPQLHFCAGSRFGPEVQSRSDSLGPLPNSRQTPMSGAAAGFQNFGIDTLSIIPDAQSQFTLVVSDLYFDSGGGGMAYGIRHRFLADAQQFLFDLALHWPVGPLYLKVHLG